MSPVWTSSHPRLSPWAAILRRFAALETEMFSMARAAPQPEFRCVAGAYDVIRFGLGQLLRRECRWNESREAAAECSPRRKPWVTAGSRPGT